MSEPKQISELIAWICTEPDGGDGIPAVEFDGVAMPLVGADRARIESLRPFALQVANELGLAVRLVRFSFAETLEEIPHATRLDA